MLFDRTSTIANVSTVASDQHVGGRLITRLLQGGARQTSYLADLENSSTSRERETGILAQLHAQGQDLFERGVGKYECKQATRERFSSADEPPDGLFVAYDYIVFADIDVLGSAPGLRIPDDVQIGFDNLPHAH